MTRPARLVGLAAAVLVVTAALLRLAGHEVSEAHDGHQALREAEAFRPDVVFLDIGLPGLNGYEVARLLREKDGTRGTVLVALTGYAKDEDRDRSHESGFDCHLVKPFHPEELLRLLETFPSRT